MMIVLGFSLTACDNYTVEELVEDEDTRMKILRECEKMSQSEIQKEKKCMVAIEAQAQALTGNLLKGLMLQK